MGKETYIQIKECQDGYLYRIDARNASLGIWDAEKKGFVIRRTQYEKTFLWMEFHWDAPLGTAKPLEVLEKATCADDVTEQFVYLANAEKRW